MRTSPDAVAISDVELWLVGTERAVSGLQAIRDAMRTKKLSHLNVASSTAAPDGIARIERFIRSAMEALAKNGGKSKKQPA